MKHIILGTGNIEKVSDFKLILQQYERLRDEYEVLTLREASKMYDLNISEAKEEGHTVEENTMSKIHFYKTELNRVPDLVDSLLISEDTGLFIKSLDWNPGVHTARFVGDHDFSKIADKIIELMEGEISRRAFVKSAVALTVIGRGEYTTRISSASMHGVISTEVYRGPGFDFDKMFIRNGSSCTLAEEGNSDPLVRLYIPRATALQNILQSMDPTSFKTF